MYLCTMACRLGLEYCMRSCGCANCPENISASPIYVKTTPEQDKFFAETGACGGIEEDESHCLQCQYISCCTGDFGSYVRIKNNISPSKDYGETLAKFNHDFLDSIFGL